MSECPLAQIIVVGLFRALLTTCSSHKPTSSNGKIYFNKLELI